MLEPEILSDKSMADLHEQLTYLEEKHMRFRAALLLPASHPLFGLCLRFQGLDVLFVDNLLTEFALAYLPEAILTEKEYLDIAHRNDPMPANQPQTAASSPSPSPAPPQEA